MFQEIKYNTQLIGDDLDRRSYSNFHSTFHVGTSITKCKHIHEYRNAEDVTKSIDNVAREMFTTIVRPETLRIPTLYIR